MLVFCRFAALRTDTVRQLQEVHRMKKRTRRPARHFHPLGIVLLAALAMAGCTLTLLLTGGERRDV